MTLPNNPLRTKALAWWRELRSMEQKEMAKKYLPVFVNYLYVTGLQIEIMYLEEHPEESKETFLNEPLPGVNLNQSFESFKQVLDAS